MRPTIANCGEGGEYEVNADQLHPHRKGHRGASKSAQDGM